VISATTGDHARNSAALSVAQSRNVLGAIPVISGTVDVTCAGWPMAAAQAWRSMFTATSGATASNSCRAWSGEIFSMRSTRPSTRPIADSCSNHHPARIGLPF
jgi:hypothetical protein